MNRTIVDCPTLTAHKPVNNAFKSWPAHKIVNVKKKKTPSTYQSLLPYYILSFARVRAKSQDDNIVSFIFCIFLIGFNAVEDQMILSKLTEMLKRKGAIPSLRLQNCTQRVPIYN